MDAMKNPYEDGFEISFSQLAKDDPDFAKVLKPKGYLDFSDPASVLQLNYSLLKRDFGLYVELPHDRLCPGIPNRLNYLLWLHELLSSSSPTGSAPDREITGLDIGTGASAIYPLLGCATNPTWTFLATDIDERSLTYAKRNIDNNKLDDRITLISSTATAPLIPLKEPSQDIQLLDFVMCNPPFYSSFEALEKSAKLKSKPPNSACTGSANEMVCEGGEVAFVSRIIDESLVLRERIQWYSSMVGHLSSLHPLLDRLEAEGCENWAVGELVQGTKTKRWVLAWSWQGWRPSAAIARGPWTLSLDNKYLPFPPEYAFGSFSQSIEQIKEYIGGVMSDMDLLWRWDDDRGQGTAYCHRICWNRQAKRRKMNHGSEPSLPPPVHKPNMQKMSDEELAKLPFIVSIDYRKYPHSICREVNLTWRKGLDQVWFESFCGMVKARMGKLVKCLAEGGELVGGRLVDKKVEEKGPKKRYPPIKVGTTDSWC